MFRSIDNSKDIDTVSNTLHLRSSLSCPTECIIKDLDIRLTNNTQCFLVTALYKQMQLQWERPILSLTQT